MICFFLLSLKVNFVQTSTFPTTLCSTSFFRSNAFNFANEKATSDSFNYISLLQSKTKQIELLTISMTQVFISVRSVSFSSSQYLAHTFLQYLLSYGSYTAFMTETYLNSQFLYIFPTFSPSFSITQIPFITIDDDDDGSYKFLVIMNLPVCFLIIILVIGILLCKRKKEQKKFIDEYCIIYDIENENENQNEQIETNEVDLNITKIESPDDSWL